MKGFKGFGQGLVCRGKKFYENTIFYEKCPSLCKSGFHFCVNPMDVLDFYPLLNGLGDFNDFSSVEALDDVLTFDNHKFCSSKIRIGSKFSISGFIKACVDFFIEKIGVSFDSTASSDYVKFSSSDSKAHFASSGKYSQLAASGNDVQLASSGYDSKLSSSGFNSKLFSSGSFAHLAVSGNCAHLASSGEFSHLASSGNCAELVSTGEFSQLSASGNEVQLASSGSYSKIVSSGDHAQLVASGEYSVVSGIGLFNSAKAAKGCWITLAEWCMDTEKDCFIPVCVKTEYVDGERIKSDVLYTLVNGEFVEV